MLLGTIALEILRFTEAFLKLIMQFVEGRFFSYTLSVFDEH